MENETSINAETLKTNLHSHAEIILDGNTLVDITQTKVKQSKVTKPFFTPQSLVKIMSRVLPRTLTKRRLQRHWFSPTASIFPRIRDQCPELMKKIMPYLTIGTLYILSDPLMDFGFVAISPPWDTVYYIGRYAAVILYSLVKFLRKRDRAKTAPIFVRLGENLSFKQRRRSPAARLRRSVEKTKGGM